MHVITIEILPILLRYILKFASEEAGDERSQLILGQACLSEGELASLLHSETPAAPCWIRPIPKGLETTGLSDTLRLCENLR